MFGRNRQINVDRIGKEYSSFVKRMLNTKHAFWFEVLDSKRKFKLFIFWKEMKHSYMLRKKTLSLNKFMFKQRKSKKFHVPTALIRDNAINKILK